MSQGKVLILGQVAVALEMSDESLQLFGALWATLRSSIVKALLDILVGQNSLNSIGLMLEFLIVDDVRALNIMPKG